MGFTYSGDPSASALDQTRFLIGDTMEAGAMFQDAEIEYGLTQTGSVPLEAAVFLVRAGMARYSRAADKSVGDLSISYSQIAAGLKALLPVLEQQRRTGLGVIRIFAGGISKAQKESTRLDPDADLSPFEKDQFENRRFP